MELSLQRGGGKEGGEGRGREGEEKERREGGRGKEAV